MWLAEMAVFIAVSVATFMVILASLRGPATLDAGATALLIIVSAAVGALVSNRFRAWILRRRGK